jgi:hypothetical protein
LRHYGYLAPTLASPLTVGPGATDGRTLVVYIEFQANPVIVGSHDAEVSLYDGGRPVASNS